MILANKKYLLYFVLIFPSLFTATALYARYDEAVSGESINVDNVNLRFTSTYRSPPLPTRASSTGQFWNPKCEGLIKNDGTYGERGLKLKKEITGQGKSDRLPATFFGDGKEIRELDKHCPSFSKMNDDEKLNFWIWTFAIIAAHESACEPTEKNSKASNGVAIGEYMTPLEEHGDGPEWRGKGCTEPPAFDTQDSQASCAVQILVDHLEGMHHNKPTFPTKKGSYWEVLRGDNPNQEFFKDFTPCFK